MLSRPVIINFVAFQAAWFIAVLGAAWGYPWIGPIAVVAWIAAFRVWHPSARDDLVLLVGAGLIGLVTDSVSVLTGVITFPEPAGPGFPTTIWMIALWINFAASIRHSLNWIRGRYALGLVFGGIGGPLAYFAGEKMGALVIHSPLGVVLAWVVAMPLILLLEQASNRSLSRQSGSADGYSLDTDQEKL